VQIRVRFCETDLMGIVHHATYLVYFEAARVEWLRRRGVTYAEWAARGIHLPVVETHVKYRAPAKFDDALDVEVRLVELRTVSLRYEYRIMNAESGALLVEGSTRLACVDGEHALQKFPEGIVDVLSSGERA
jgi:acyl-CoA thioester hydrolase